MNERETTYNLAAWVLLLAILCGAGGLISVAVVAPDALSVVVIVVGGGVAFFLMCVGVSVIIVAMSERDRARPRTEQHLHLHGAEAPRLESEL